MFLALGASAAIGVDDEEVYVEPGSRFFASLYPNITIKQTQRGLIPLQSESVDFVLVNEVISHVNFEYLDTVYREISRVLRPGGVVLISDGNNFANVKYKEEFTKFWDSWENGPDGVATDRDVVGECYVSRRRRIIRTQAPELKEDQVEYLALNTSGLFGTGLSAEVERYRRGEEFIARPYVQGMVPVNPSPSGVLIERGFTPQQVIASLDEFGIEGRQVFPSPPEEWEKGGVGWRDVIEFARWRLFGERRPRIQSLFSPDEWRGTSESFMIRGVKASGNVS